MKQNGRTLLQIINDVAPDRDFGKKDVCVMFCGDARAGCSCCLLDLFTKRRFVEVSA
ncbi:MAG: hypothetical protein NWF00_04995 [Candidatus Bathyarchaeota archaeon]|nr:hypothetical protein [Candidatus Bathyarchaeota archaeon]